MRKALIGLILAATVLTPLAAQAQERGERRSRHVQQEDSAGSSEQRAQRQENRQQRQQQRAQVQQQRVQVQQQSQPQVQVAQRDRRGGSWRGNDGNRGGDRGNWQGNRGGDRGSWQGNDGNRGGDRSNWRGGDRNQNQNSTVQGWGGPNTREYREHADRYNRRAQENALRYGTQEQRREVYQQRRGDRDGNWRGDRDGNWRGDRDRNWRDGRRHNWDGGWRNDRRYDWNRWRYSNRNIFRLPSYYSPYRNHRYSRFGIGFFLDSLFYDQRYWIGDPWQYRLPAAPPGTQWVRYYNDVILVDVYSGEVIDVIYDFFW